MRVLFLSRTMPYPLTDGARIYSAGIASALAASGAQVVFVGLQFEQAPETIPGVEWHVVPGGERGRLSAAFSRLPFVAARHATSAYRNEIKTLLASDRWDAVIIDHYGVAWALDLVPRGAATRVFIAHNHEAGVTGRQWRDRTRSLPARAYYLQNWLKTRSLERRAARASDLMTAITASDASEFAKDAPDTPVIQLSPGYAGAKLATRTITADTPRAIVMFGSFRWSAKRASLEQLLEAAAPTMRDAGITVDVLGDMDDRYRRTIAERFPTVRFHGRVGDPTPFLRAARLALVAEPVGGGFKLKLLEYIFNRVPVAALDECASGLPAALQAHMILAPDLASLLPRVVTEIDDVEALNARQARAFALASGAFDWSDRGRRLLDAIQRRQQSLPPPSAATRPEQRRAIDPAVACTTD